jgi:spore coat-associated protein N
MGFFGGTSKKVLLSVAALGVSAGIAGLGTFASFTSTTSASQTVASGTVAIALGAPGAANRLTVNASGLVPGDTVQRAFTLSNTGNQSLASIGLTTTASPSSLLDTDATNGLQMVVERCSVAWVELGSSPAFDYTCAGVTTTVIASRPVIGANLNMASLSSLTNGGSDQLRLTLTLPSTAGNTLQGLSSTLTYTFLGTQRTASDH